MTEMKIGKTLRLISSPAVRDGFGIIVHDGRPVLTEIVSKALLALPLFEGAFMLISPTSKARIDKRLKEQSKGG